MTEIPIERHPWQPFLPAGARVLMLGSFPPLRHRWSMDFFYPNFQNDMWRIIGLLFFSDREYFTDDAHKHFDRQRCVKFCTEHGIALYDTATAVRRLKENAADKFLDVVEPTDIASLLRQIPKCQTVVVTGEKAAETVLLSLGKHALSYPKVGDYIKFDFEERVMWLWRMPSSSRAYPLALEKKAAHYDRMFREVGILKR